MPSRSSKGAGRWRILDRKASKRQKMYKETTTGTQVSTCISVLVDGEEVVVNYLYENSIELYCINLYICQF
jgi:hypothetical protein